MKTQYFTTASLDGFIATEDGRWHNESAPPQCVNDNGVRPSWRVCRLAGTASALQLYNDFRFRQSFDNKAGIDDAGSCESSGSPARRIPE